MNAKPKQMNVRPGLYETTLSLLARSPEGVMGVSRAAGVNYDWLRKVQNGEIPAPTCHKLQRVHDYLVYGE